ncbi:MAG TPA: porphobilinogen synthase [Planctomycetia bacterium]|nr:porphobilinogen synthase [Planctomycetia bacterium]
MGFPTIRPRRLRATPELRALVRETNLSPDDLVYPMFFNAAIDAPRPVSTMPGVDQLPPGAAAAQAKALKERGIGAVILFGLPKTKDDRGTSGLDPDGPVPRAIAEMKGAVPDLVVMADVCVDEYTEHGHCGVLTKRSDGSMVVDNDATIEILAKMAVVFARAGADVVAPSDMMDGRVGAIRGALDAEGFTDVSILAYTAKYASAFYGPFREALDSAPKFGDKKTYQMDPANRREALRELELDEDEGADMVMVKPAGPYLDVIRELREATSLPIAAYQVSGEYAMLKAAGANGWIDEKRAVLESLLSIRRAGADCILTYYARQAARWLAGA